MNAPTTTSSRPGQLPRRALLGARVASDERAFSEAGTRIEGVLVDSMAAAARLERGDVLVRVADLPVRSPAELADALRRAGASDEIDLVFERDGVPHTARVGVVRQPVEALPGHRVSYEVVPAPDGARLRSIVTRPIDTTRRLPAMLCLQGIACDSIDSGAAPYTPMCRFVHGCAQMGLVTMRVDKRGAGDSEGPPCADADFETELADHRAALATLVNDATVDPERIVLFGHSVGGMVAPLLASERRVRAIVVYGASSGRWRDCVVESARRQRELRQEPSDERFFEELRARFGQEAYGGRSAAYHAQLDALDLAAAWQRLEDARVLVLRGEHDWVVSPGEQAQIAAVVDRRWPGRSRVIDVRGLDHAFGWHGTAAESLRDYGRGRFDAAIVTHTVAWLVEQGVLYAP